MQKRILKQVGKATAFLCAALLLMRPAALAAGEDTYFPGYVYNSLEEFREALEDEEQAAIFAQEYPEELGAGSVYLPAGMTEEDIERLTVAFTYVETEFDVDETTIALRYYTDAGSAVVERYETLKEQDGLIFQNAAGEAVYLAGEHPSGETEYFWKQEEGYFLLTVRGELEEEPLDAYEKAVGFCLAEPAEARLEEETGQTARVTAILLNVRRGPGTKFKKIGGLKKGEIVEIVEEQGEWTLIRWEESKEGYVSSRYLAWLETDIIECY